MEVRKTVAALDLVDPQLDFAEGVVFILLEVGEGDFEDATFEGVIGVFETSGAVNEGFADTLKGIVVSMTGSREVASRSGLLSHFEAVGCFD